MNILHGLTASVATTIASKFKESYIASDFKFKCIATDDTFHFYPHSRFGEIYTTSSEWATYRNDGKVLHIELRKWADVFVIAPCSANTLAKIANGICDNLLTCVARAWDFEKQFIVAPSMNDLMYSHPITQEHIKKIEGWGIKVVEPVEKTLFCGDTGIGAMAHIDDIVAQIKL